MIYYIPLETLDERYTVMLDRLLQAEMRSRRLPYLTVHGQQLGKRIKSGAFLDSCGTIAFKASQIQAIARRFYQRQVEAGDVFFFADLWFPGIDALPYMGRFNGIDIRICGFQYAGSWTPTDYVAQYLSDYCRLIEHGWLQFWDSVFLCSTFQKREILQNLRLPENSEGIERKLRVTRLPFDFAGVRRFYRDGKREPWIVFPHRFHWEKGADTFLTMALEVGYRLPDAQFLITSARSGDFPQADRPDIADLYHETKRLLGDRLRFVSNLSKSEFYTLLSAARIVWSSSLQENFGYSIIESCTLGATPVLPRRVAYPEMYPEEYLYSSEKIAYDMVVDYFRTPKPLSPDLLRALDGTSEVGRALAEVAGQ